VKLGMQHGLKHYMLELKTYEEHDIPCKNHSLDGNSEFFIVMDFFRMHTPKINQCMYVGASQHYWQTYQYKCLNTHVLVHLILFVYLFLLKTLF
jgi:hypothetical protein